MLLTSPQNPWIRQLRHLQQPKGRREQQAFLLEGSHLLQEALATAWPLRAVCYTPEWAEDHPHLIAGIPTHVRQQAISAPVLKHLATTTTPDGVIAIAHRLDPLLPAQRPAQGSPTLSISLGVAVETLQDPGNLGALIRVAAATSSDALWISSDSVDPDHPKVLRASAGQWFRRSPQVVSDLRSDLGSLLQSQPGIQTLAAVMDPAAPLHWECNLQQPTLFVLGNEGSGLSAEVMAACSGQIRIPMAAEVESLNVAMTGGILLYEALRQRRLT